MGEAARRPRRWFWGLTVTAVLALGLLVRQLGAPPSPVTGLLTLVSGLVLLASSVQAGRIFARLAEPPGGARRGHGPPAFGGRKRSS